MIDKPTKIVNLELHNVRVTNMGVAKYYGILKEYNQVLQETRKLNKKELEKNGEKAELNIYYSVRYNLNLMVLEKILEDKNPEEVKNICMAYLNRMKAKKNEKI
jgi:hypothetical protein